MPFESGEHSLFIFMWIWMSLDFSWPLRLYYGRILFVTKPTLTTYLTRYFPAHSFLIPENLPVNARIFLGTLRVYILDLVKSFIDHPYHSANPALHINLHILWYTFSALSGCGTTEHDLSPAQLHPFLCQGYCEYPLHYFHGSKRNRGLCLGRVCLNFTEIKGFRQPIRLWGKLFVGMR